MKLGSLRPDASFGLVAMPWFWATMPSIQLGIVGQLLAEYGTPKVHEFYVDLADRIGLDLYARLALDEGFVAERLFTLSCFDALENDKAATPFLGLHSKPVEDAIFTFLPPVIDDLLDKWTDELLAQNYDAMFFTLNINQNGASMLMAKRLKQRRPDLPIIFGGSSCAGPMGRAIAKVCPEVDIVVHGEAEATLSLLMKALQKAQPNLGHVPAVSWREGDEIRTNARVPLHTFHAERRALSFDDYFDRINSSENLNLADVWIPFESSRGCWYGEHSQCTFCGLNEVIAYRERDNSTLIDELASYHERYDCTQFFSVDLIMPMHFFKDVLPRIEQADRDWSIFYEVKANLKREQIRQLANSGVQRVQPGIESLHDDVLKLMKKGVSALQNVLMLKWGEQYGIDVDWNIITGFPGEQPTVYEEMAALVPKLHHLQAPGECEDFAVHRFSPCFEKPAEHGIRVLGADRRYRFVYPVDADTRDNIGYRFEYELLPDFPATDGMKRTLRAAVQGWRQAWRRGAVLEVVEYDDGTLELVDSRASETAVSVPLPPEEASFMRFMDTQRGLQNVAGDFEMEDAESFAALGGKNGVQNLMARWEAEGYLMRIGSRLAALPTWRKHEPTGHAGSVNDGGNDNERSYAEAS
jgi:ribosomal peptide maturation radical SAM protein 1